MKYKRVKRSGILFVFLSIITLRIYTLFYLHFVGKDVNTFAKKRLMPYPIVWILDWIFLGIPTLIYMSTLSRRVEEKAVELSVYDHRTGFGKFFNWCLFGSLLIVGPFVAYCSTFRTLNSVLAKLNALESEPKKEEKPEASAAKEGLAKEPSKAEQQPSGLIVSVAPTPSQEVLLLESTRSEKPAPQEAVVLFEGKPAPSNTKKWRVRYANKADAVMTFSTQEEAIAYARSLASKNGSVVRVRPK